MFDEQKLVPLVHDWRGEFEKRKRHSYFDGFYSVRSMCSQNKEYTSLEIRCSPKIFAFADKEGLGTQKTSVAVSNSARRLFSHTYLGVPHTSLFLRANESLESFLFSYSLGQRSFQADFHTLHILPFFAHKELGRTFFKAEALLERYKNSDTTQ